MAKISFLSNIASLQAQRRLTENSKDLSKSNERLSSGLRITRASDDAAGIAIAASLNVDGRVFTQAIRNLNDGISLLNIAEGSVSEARNIVFRLRELGEQSANGVLTSVQRQSIDGEGQALISEYNRIISVTEFNGLKLIDGSLTNLTLQAGYGTSGELTVSIGQQLPRNLGGSASTTTADGTFQGSMSYSSGLGPFAVALGDANGDGKLDLITADFAADKVSVSIGNGNGTFKARTSYSTGTDPYSVALGDLNGDGKLDIVETDNVAFGAGKTNVFFGNGNGTFQARTSYSDDNEPASVALGDFNGDGKLDILTGHTSTLYGISVFIGNGNGTFKARTSYSSGSTPYSVSLGDFNGDGKLDVVAVISNSNKVGVRLGNADGTFQVKITYSTGLFTFGGTVGDVNGDGKLDIVTGDYTDSKTSVLLGNGNGTFQARTSYSTGASPRSVVLGDLNLDGKLDIVSADSLDDKTSVLLGNGNGTFQARTSYSPGDGPLSVALGDINNDGTLDIATAASNDSKASILLAYTITTTTGTPISFLTQASSLAALTTLASVQTSIENELANIGSTQSRLGTAVSNLQQTRENYNAAESRIVDVDVAEESANLVKRQILQNASSAILAQANQEPALLLKLLEP